MPILKSHLTTNVKNSGDTLYASSFQADGAEDNVCLVYDTTRLGKSPGQDSVGVSNINGLKLFKNLPENIRGAERSNKISHFLSQSFKTEVDLASKSIGGATTTVFIPDLQEGKLYFGSKGDSPIIGVFYDKNKQHYLFKQITDNHHVKRNFYDKYFESDEFKNIYADTAEEFWKYLLSDKEKSLHQNDLELYSKSLLREHYRRRTGRKARVNMSDSIGDGASPLCKSAKDRWEVHEGRSKDIEGYLGDSNNFGVNVFNVEKYADDHNLETVSVFSASDGLFHTRESLSEMSNIVNKLATDNNIADHYQTVCTAIQQYIEDNKLYEKDDCSAALTRWNPQFQKKPSLRLVALSDGHGKTGDYISYSFVKHMISHAQNPTKVLDQTKCYSPSSKPSLEAWEHAFKEQLLALFNSKDISKYESKSSYLRDLMHLNLKFTDDVITLENLDIVYEECISVPAISRMLKFCALQAFATSFTEVLPYEISPYYGNKSKQDEIKSTLLEPITSLTLSDVKQMSGDKVLNDSFDAMEKLIRDTLSYEGATNKPHEASRDVQKKPHYHADNTRLSYKKELLGTNLPPLTHANKVLNQDKASYDHGLD